MVITVNSEKKEVPEGISLKEVLDIFTPYGEEATIIVQNGTYHKSIDLDGYTDKVSEGDDIQIVPLIIGG